MWRFRDTTVLALSLMVMTTVVLRELSAQSVFYTRDREAVLTFEFTKPSFDGNVSFGTSASYVGYRVPVRTGAAFVADLPFAILAVNGDVESSVGNPFLGVDIALGTAGASLRLGGRVPIVSEDDVAWVVGFYHDIDRLGAWLPNMVPLQALFMFQRRNAASGLITRFSVGPEVWVSTDDADASDLFARYTAQVGYATDQVILMGGFAGMLNLTTGRGFGERSIHEAMASISLSGSSVRPGVHLRIPLDEDLTDTVNYSIGVNLAVALPG